MLSALRTCGGCLGLLLTAAICLDASTMGAHGGDQSMQTASAEKEHEQSSPSGASQTARDVLARVRPAVIQIRGFFGSNSTQAFHGTGFAVAPGGVFVTNYHVVSQYVQQPTKYRLEFRTPDDQTGEIAVLEVDVRHDLALVRAVGHRPDPLELQTELPAKGERAFSVGFPLDVGLTITEGVSNGKVVGSFEQRIHYSGALNGGMSGGPAFNAAGKVIGVNVSAYRNQQSIAFLVPSIHAAALSDRARGRVPSPDRVKDSIGNQLHEHGAALLSALDMKRERQSISGYVLPAKIASFIDCGGTGDTTTDSNVQTVQIGCAAKAGLFVRQGLYAGDIRFHHTVVTSQKLDRWRFAHRLSMLSTLRGRGGARQHVGPYACSERVVGLTGFDADVALCVRSYHALRGLYDIALRVSSLGGDRQGFASQLELIGLGFDAGMAFVQKFLDAMERKP